MSQNNISLFEEKLKEFLSDYIKTKGNPNPLSDKDWVIQTICCLFGFVILLFWDTAKKRWDRIEYKLGNEPFRIIPLV
jgi:glucuronate isomerase